MKRTLFLVASLFIIGCEGGTPSAPTVESLDVPPLLLTPGGADDFYDAGDTITLVTHFASGAGAPDGVITAAETAAGRWNSEVLGLTGHENDLPHFNPQVIGGTTASGTIARIVYADDCTGPDCGYCGSFNGEVGGIREIQLQRRDLGDPCGGLGRVVDDLSGVIVHELSHVLGFAHQSDPETIWCVTNVPSQGSLNPHPCRWEQQSVYAAYGLRNTDPLPVVSIASKIVILPNPDTVLTGSSDTIRAYGLVGPEPSENVDAGGEPGLPWVLPPDTIFVNVNWNDLGSPYFDAAKIDQFGRARIDGVQIGQDPIVGTAADQANDTVATAYPWPGDTAMVVVESASGLNPCFDPDHLVTWRMTDQYLTTSCGSTGTNIQYRWRFQAGGAWTSFSPDTLHEFFGHSTADTFQVTVEVKDTSSGATEQFSRDFEVRDQIMTISGPTYVTTKDVQTYQASSTANWFERYETSLEWYWAGWTTPTTYDRIWPAGDYTRRLRGEGGSGGAVGRDWLDVVVCHESVPGCGPPVLVALDAGGEHLERGFPLFGGGPWIVTDGDIVRFYDLTGGHDPGSPFADVDWVDAYGERHAASADGGSALTWNVAEATADTRRVRFSVDGVGDVYTFGLALDPDVGRSPADDRSAYDAKTGAVVVHDNEEALAIALRAHGANDIQGIQQYGVRVAAPRAADELRRATQAAGVRLIHDPDDVQLLVRGSTASGVEEWTLLMARGDGVDDALARLSKLMSR